MKFIVCGEFALPTYQEALSYGLKKNGAEVVECKLRHYGFYHLLGTIKNSIKLYKIVKKEKPDVVFLYRVINILPWIIPILKRRDKKLKVFIYHNDDPYRKGLWRRLTSLNFLRCIRYADITYVYRDVNIDEARRWGAKDVKIYMSHFDSRHDLKELQPDSFKKDTEKIVYIGHFENDYRVDVIDYLYRHGVDLDIYSDELFDKAFEEHNWPQEHNFNNVYREEYRKVISQSAMALAFFSTANRDKYTRRCFEIPIMGTLLLAPKTEVTERIFRDGMDAILYNSAEDLFEKITFLNSHKEKRDEIACNGYEMMKKGEHSEIARAAMVINDYNLLKL